MFTRIIRTALPIIAMTGLIGSACSSQETTTTTTLAPLVTTTTETPETTQAPEEYTASRVDEIMMVQAIQDSTGMVEGWDFQASTVVDTAYLICANLRAGATAEEVMDMVVQSASSPETLRFLTAVTAGAITYICPDMAYKVG